MSAALWMREAAAPSVRPLGDVCWSTLSVVSGVKAGVGLQIPPVKHMRVRAVRAAPRQRLFVSSSLRLQDTSWPWGRWSSSVCLMCGSPSSPPDRLISLTWCQWGWWPSDVQVVTMATYSAMTTMLMKPLHYT